MSVVEIMESAQFVVGQDGAPTAVILNIKTWEALLAMLEDVEDANLVQERIKNWRTKAGWTSWADFEAELQSVA